MPRLRRAGASSNNTTEDRTEVNRVELRINHTASRQGRMASHIVSCEIKFHVDDQDIKNKCNVKKKIKKIIFSAILRAGSVVLPCLQTDIFRPPAASLAGLTAPVPGSTVFGRGGGNPSHFPDFRGTDAYIHGIP
ncbi:hypothetical protein JXO52_07505 [bacterium]|nr:hypothetical protein [bacterium]